MKTHAVGTLLGVLLGLMSAGLLSGRAAEPSDKEAAEIAREAYVYFYPLVLMDITRQQMTGGPDHTPLNRFHNLRTFPTADFREVVRPNFDTLYSSAWIDLRGGPVVVTVPDTEGRYYLLPMLDMWTDVFAVPGKRTTGTQAGKFALAPPGWTGPLPTDATRIDAPTNFVWILGRIQTNGPKDYDAVHKIQDGLAIEAPPKGSEIEPNRVAPALYVADPKKAPLEQVAELPAATFFPYAAELMKANPPHLTDEPIVARMKRLGIVPGESFDFAKAGPAAQAALHAAPQAGLTLMQAQYPKLMPARNGWMFSAETIGVYGADYLKRAIVAMAGLGANRPEDAVYPLNVADATGHPVMGGRKYLLRFEKKEIPPVDAFWSLTMYDAEGYQVANPINRFALGDRDALKFNADGSLDLYIQPDSPGADKESNWLPAPKSGTLGLTLRLYAPRPEVLEGGWVPPAVKPVK